MAEDSSFPSLVIRANSVIPKGAFAETQARFLQPEAQSVSELERLLEEKQIGVVAHFYMDAELQGVLSACGWPHIQIADSLAMADRAVTMAEAGMRTIVVLGVDFMSENVRAVLDAAGHPDVAVYRVSSEAIGCSLAESAEADAYGAYLRRGAQSPNALHVIYINTSLEVKARSQSVIPTITCTSSNVVKTILQAAAQVPDVEIWYGPDTYMGENLRSMFTQFASLPDELVAKLHPAHTAASVAALLGRFHIYEQGTCIVHHLFGAEVVERVKRDHADALFTAHLEVPGEMFALASEAQRLGRGVVGSTSNILGFIASEVERLANQPGEARISFVLGTEAGMITAIVKRVQAVLRERERHDIAVEIVFPVAAEAVAQDDVFGIVPGVAAGEGCSVAGGCATCPFMKMNDLDALFEVLERVGSAEQAQLVGFEPRKYTGIISGRTIAELGGEPILAMRHFQQHGVLPVGLVSQVRSGAGVAS